MKIFNVKRLDKQPRIIFIGSVRLDPETNILDESQVNLLKDHKSYKEYAKAKIIEIEELDLSDSKAVKKLIDSIPSKNAKTVAKELLDSLISKDEDEDEAENDGDGENGGDSSSPEDDLDGMSFDELKTVIEAEELEVVIKSNYNLDTCVEKIRKARSEKKDA